MNDEPAVPHRALAAWGLVVGPVAFVSAWAIGGLQMPDYSPVHDAISRLAAVGSPQRALMSTGFVVYGVAVAVGGLAVRSSIIGRAWPAVVINGLATLAVAALPLDVSPTGDQAHGVAATVGYVSLALAPALAAGPLVASGRRRAAAVSVVASVSIGVCLALTVVADANGAFQRIGLGIGDVWLVAAGLSLVAARFVRPRPA
ncbi:MAG: DUF998 domain-containing protein [Aquihabitans sp.]